MGKDMVREEISFIGLQRTGTNYVEQIFRAAIQKVVLTDRYVWKHSLREEAGDAPIGEVLIVARHPVLWLQSCLLNSPKDIKQNRFEFFAGDVDPVVGFANLYNRFYKGWLKYRQEAGGYLVRYEDVLERGSAVFAELLRGRYEIVSVLSGSTVLPQSIQMSNEMLNAAVERECTIAKEVVQEFWTHIDHYVKDNLSYDFKEIKFLGSSTRQQKLRSAAYKLIDTPKTLGNEEFDLLLQEGINSFHDDGLVLGEIGRKLFADGNVGSALDYLAYAVLAIQRQDRSVFGMELDSRLADYLELLSKSCRNILERQTAVSGDRLRAQETAEVFFPDDDSFVLGEEGRRALSNGDIEGALKSLGEAVIAQRNIKSGLEDPLDSRFCDCLRLLSKLCLEVREMKLEGLVRHYTYMDPKETHYKAGTAYNLSRCLMKLGKLDLAIRHAERAVEFADLAPTRKGEVVLWIDYLGDLLAKTGQHPQAIEKYCEAATRDPSDFRHHFRLAKEYRRLKDRERMFISLDEALRLNPDDTDAIGFKVTALREFDPGNAEIIPLARSWVIRKPSASVAKFCLSDELRKAGEVDEAIQYARTCVETGPEVPRHHRLLADLLALKKQWREALAVIEEAIHREPTRASHHRFRGKMLINIGQFEEARNSLDVATRCADARADDFRLLGQVSDRLRLWTNGSASKRPSGSITR
jgi:tetratricopeptide (TPR) repeat protein